MIHKCVVTFNHNRDAFLLCDILRNFDRILQNETTQVGIDIECIGTSLKSGVRHIWLPVYLFPVFRVDSQLMMRQNRQTSGPDGLGLL